MTTIATDGRSMAADGMQCVSGTVSSLSAVKLFRLKDGSIIGGCGEMGDLAKLVEWLDAGAKDDPPALEKDFGAVMLCADGAIKECGQSGRLIPCEKPFAMGSGMDLALGAMDAGKSPSEAVAIAARRNPYTGGTITEIHL